MNRTRGAVRRRGVVALTTALIFLVLLGMLAFAIDIGFIVMTRTSLQAAADAAALAGGTELRQGLGFRPPRSSEFARILAALQATSYAARHPAGDVDSVYLDPWRQVDFGNAQFDPSSGRWTRNWGSPPYNLIGIDLLRSPINTSSRGGPLPLFFGPLIGTRTANVQVRAEAVLLPIDGFRIDPGAGIRANVMPFAFDKETWDDLLIAQRLYEESGQLDLTNPIYRYPNGDQRFFDNFRRSSSGSVTAGADGVLEMDLYPYEDKSLPSGNRGTVDLGAPNNSTSDVVRQILNGLDDVDVSYFPDNQIVFDEANPLTVQGDVGISGGFKEELESIRGECRVIPLFGGVPTGRGNPSYYQLVEWASITVVEVELTGNSKRVLVQPARCIPTASVPDLDGQITDRTTVFHPLILIR